MSDNATRSLFCKWDRAAAFSVTPRFAGAYKNKATFGGAPMAPIFQVCEK